MTNEYTALLALLALCIYLAGWVSALIAEERNRQESERAEARRHIRATLRSTRRTRGI